MLSLSRNTLLAALSLIATACADNTPASIELNIQTPVLSAATEIPILATARNKKGEVLPTPPTSITYTVSDPAKAVVTQGGKLRCLKSGDLTLSAASGTATGSTAVSCRLVASLSVQWISRVVVGVEPTPLHVTAYDENGQSLADVPIRVTSSNTGVVSIDRNGLSGRAVGVASVSVSAGDRETTNDVTVVRQVKNEPLLLNDGARINQPLGPGTYEVTVEVRGGEVTLAWIGGDGCEDSEKALNITRRCHIKESGALVIENPAFLGFIGGGPADGVLRIFESPAQ